MSSIRYGAEVAPETIGVSPEGLARVVEIFDRQLAEGLHFGAQLVILRYGKVALDLAAGLANVRRKIAVTHDTPFLTWSVSKPFAGVCVHRLIEEGRVELDAPVAEYWPEFGRGGKEKATIRHVFLHQAGIPIRGLYTQLFHWPSWERVTRNVANLATEFPPGSKTAYHVVNYGFILGEVVRRVSGMPIQTYLRQHFLDPLGLANTSLGLPTERRATASGLYNGCRDQIGAVALFNLPMIRGAVLPAATLHSTARELAIFYQMLLNDGVYNGMRLLRPETIRAMTELGYEGYDEIIERKMRWAYGFQLGGTYYLNPDRDGMGKGSSMDTFGHFGQRTCMAWADRHAQLVVAFTSNRLVSKQGNQARWITLSDAIWEALEDFTALEEKSSLEIADTVNG